MLLARRLATRHCLALVLFALATFGARAHESCCEKKAAAAAAAAQPLLIPDATESAPAEFKGQPRQIPDPAHARPDNWDDEEDGPWEDSMPMIDNPAYAWAPRMVANPKYVAPPSLADKLREEVLEASGASGGGVSHEDRPYCNNEAGDSSAERRRVA